MTPPPQKHTRKLTRRQRLLPPGWIPPVALQTENSTRLTRRTRLLSPEWVPVKHNFEWPIELAPVLEACTVPPPLAGPKKLIAKVRERVPPKPSTPRTDITKIIGMSLDAWHLLIQADERKIEEDKRAEKLRRKELAAQERRAQRRGRRKRYYQEFYGPSWFPVQAEAMARAKGICEICKTSKATEVHHILPIRYFLDSEDAHFINNTLAVCIPCHKEEHRQLKNKFPLFNHLKLALCRPGRRSSALLRFSIQKHNKNAYRIAALFENRQQNSEIEIQFHNSPYFTT